MRATLEIVRSLFLGRLRRLTELGVLAALVMTIEAAGTALVLGLISALANGQIDPPIIGSIVVGEASFTRYAIVVGVFFVVIGLATVVQDLYFHRVVYREGAMLEERLLRGYLSMSTEETERRDRSELIRNVHDSVITVLEGTVIPLIAATAVVLKVVSVVVIMFVVSPLPSLALCVVVLPTLAIVFRIVNPVVHRLGEDVEQGLADSLAVVSETIELGPEIRAAGAVDRFSSRFGAVRLRLGRLVASEETLQSVPRVVSEVVLVSFVIGYTIWASSSADASSEVLTTLGIFGYAALRVLPSMVAVVHLVHSIRFSRPAAEALMADVDLVRAEADDLLPLPLETSIRFDQVSYRHHGADRDALIDVDLTLEPGEVVALVGPNGAGKSTFLGLLTGQLAPSGGDIAVDGRVLAVEDRTRERWARAVGLVAQRVNLLDADVLGNVTLLDETVPADDDGLRAALAAGGVDAMLHELPDGVSSPLGPGGRRLSGGQRQRVAIARALFGNHALLAFDEVTSALDDAARTELVDALTAPAPSRLTVFITHDPAVALRCTRVVTLQQGRVVSDGPPTSTLDPSLLEGPVEHTT